VNVFLSYAGLPNGKHRHIAVISVIQCEDMSSQPRSFNVEFDGTTAVFHALTLQDAITFCECARLVTPNPSNWVIAELDTVKEAAARQYVIDAIDLGIRHLSDTKRLAYEDRYLGTRDGMQLLFDLSLAKLDPKVTGEGIFARATEEEVLDIATRILNVTRVALKESICDD